MKFRHLARTKKIMNNEKWNLITAVGIQQRPVVVAGFWLGSARSDWIPTILARSMAISGQIWTDSDHFGQIRPASGLSESGDGGRMSPDSYIGSRRLLESSNLITKFGTFGGRFDLPTNSNARRW
jgi:hypothetical protein